MITLVDRNWPFFGRTKVYLMGHTEGEATWLASFRYRHHAEQFAERWLGSTTLSTPQNTAGEEGKKSCLSG